MPDSQVRSEALIRRKAVTASNIPAKGVREVGRNPVCSSRLASCPKAPISCTLALKSGEVTRVSLSCGVAEGRLEEMAPVLFSKLHTQSEALCESRDSWIAGFGIAGSGIQQIRDFGTAGQREGLLLLCDSWLALGVGLGEQLERHPPVPHG